MESQVAFSDLHGSGKLDGQNYAMWHRKIQFLLHKEKTLDHLTNVMPMPENRDTAQSRRDMDVYNKWLDQDKSARFTMLSCMHDNLICEFEKYSTAKELWEVLQVTYGSTSATRLRALTLKFNQHGLLVEEKTRLGSTPPRCHNKCNQCHPCMAVQVPPELSHRISPNNSTQLETAGSLGNITALDQGYLGHFHYESNKYQKAEHLRKSRI
ncbi:hypothetical protein BUALT_Bualt11G0018700 [Buddleja alternifolia]|uniref:Epidermal patterning factor-like protein n=1 Tax=Buddleja alternifolia TaxID=168488 RepID=A0AAV6WT50_9LAMI|nr:hypothetical protein BUALT_Bualt11G0018700 [Buddleja alternifolia]